MLKSSLYASLDVCRFEPRVRGSAAVAIWRRQWKNHFVRSAIRRSFVDYTNRIGYCCRVNHLKTKINPGCVQNFGSNL